MESISQKSYPPHLEDLYTVPELAVALRVPASTIYYWKSRGKITPAIDTGRNLKFLLTQVLKELGRPKQRSRPCKSLSGILDSYGLNRSLTTRDGNSAGSNERS